MSFIPQIPPSLELIKDVSEYNAQIPANTNG